MRPHRFLCSFVMFFTVGGLIPLFADSVYVTNSTPNGSQYPGITVDGTPVPLCEQSSASSASCSTTFSGHGGGYGFVDSGGIVSANAAFGALSGNVQESNGSSGRFVSSFGDNVVVTGNSGAGTLVSHYALAVNAEAMGGDDAVHFSFVQGATRTGVTPTYTDFGFTTPVPNPPAGCASTGLCFSETFDVSSPVQFGTALPLGAFGSLDSNGFGPILLPGSNSLTNAFLTLQLTGYTVLNGSGTVVGDAAVTRQNVPGLDLFAAPEPGTCALMLTGLGTMLMWALRRDRHCEE